MSVYTPDTLQVRAAYASANGFSREHGQDFDRWLADVKREAAEAGRASAQSEIDRLNNRIWDLERRWRSFDPWERAEESESEDA
jgi:hypothetical protein